MIIKDYILTNNLNIKVISYNLTEFPETGTKEELLNKYNLNPLKLLEDIK